MALLLICTPLLNVAGKELCKKENSKLSMLSTEKKRKHRLKVESYVLSGRSFLGLQAQRQYLN